MRLPHILSAVALAASIASLGLARAEAQPSREDLINAGRLIAKRYCGECHAVDPGAKSPLPDAPPLPGVYRRFPVDRMAEALELGFMDDHPRMPNFKLDADEREAITAYLKSYQPRRSEPLPSRKDAAKA
jgi:mono/diheme cytochrome c family protein